MSLSKFGPFATVFEPGELSSPGYIFLLGLSSEKCQVVIDHIESVLASGDAGGWIDVLFDDPNWRPHLVGAIALVLDGGQHFTTAGLWRAVDAGSWVTPQLVVTAYFVDPKFPQRLVERMEALCPVSVRGSMSPLERHSATGPAGTTQRSAKMMASLVFIARRLPSLSTWLDTIRADPRVTQLLEQDFDNSADITEEWLEQLTLQFALRGRQLRGCSL